ncbi:unnamed protein product, partial [marine sediment metagenome]
MTTTYNKDGAYIEVTVDGVVYRRSIKWEDVVVSFPTDTKLKIDRTYINDSDQLVLVLTDESEITLSASGEIATHAALPTVHQNAPALIQFHAELPTVHQNAPALILTHANLPTVHQNAPALIETHAQLPTVHQNAPQLITAHAGQPTVHQNAPALIQTHAELPTVHQNAPELITTHAGEADPHTGYMLESIIDAEGDIIYGSGDNAIARLAKGDDDDVLTLASGVPSWAAPAAAGVTVATGSYTGDESNDRQITTGFKCSMVILIGQAGSADKKIWFVIPDITLMRFADGTTLIRT